MGHQITFGTGITSFAWHFLGEDGGVSTRTPWLGYVIVSYDDGGNYLLVVTVAR